MFMNNFKAKFFLLLVGLNWGSLIIIMLPFLILCYFYDRVREGIQWLYSTLLAQDHVANVIMGGHYLTTISSMLGHLRATGSATGTIAANIVDWGFNVATGEVNHCTNAMQDDDVYKFSARRAIAGTVVYQYSLCLIIW